MLLKRLASATENVESSRGIEPNIGAVFFPLDRKRFTRLLPGFLDSGTSDLLTSRRHRIISGHKLIDILVTRLHGSELFSDNL
jgi:hypothetical protein